MKPNGWGAVTKTAKDDEGMIGAATILQATMSSSRTQLMGSQLSKMCLMMRLIQGESSTLVLRMRILTGTFDGE